MLRVLCGKIRFPAPLLHDFHPTKDLAEIFTLGFHAQKLYRYPDAARRCARENAMQNTHVINQLDRVRVLESFADANHPRMHKLSRALACGDTPAHIRRLIQRMQHAQPINPTLVPRDMVTMNSVVRLTDTDTLKRHRVVLVYDAERIDENAPDNAQPVEIQSELGSELLARRVGDLITLPGRTGTTNLRIVAIDYQPEAAGHFDR